MHIICSRDVEPEVGMIVHLTQEGLERRMRVQVSCTVYVRVCVFIGAQVSCNVHMDVCVYVCVCVYLLERR